MLDAGTTGRGSPLGIDDADAAGYQALMQPTPCSDPYARISA